MTPSSYEFLTQWRFSATAEEVSEVLKDIASLPRWWPSVYLEVRTLDDKRTELLTKGWLPYTLRWAFTLVECRAPHGFTIRADGDFVGTGVWSIDEIGGEAIVTFDWRIRAEKPLLKVLSPLLKPIFAANHRWAMEQGEHSLRLELIRRRAKAEGFVLHIPEPPAPTWPHRSKVAKGSILTPKPLIR